MKKRPKLTWKNLNWPVVWIIIIYIVVTVAVLMACGCVNVTKNIDIYVINPTVNIEAEIE